MATQDEKEQQQRLLEAYRRTLAHLLEQAAQYGGEVFAPPQTANGIHEARTNIQRIKATLRSWDVSVDDRTDEDGPRPPTRRAWLLWPGIIIAVLAVVMIPLLREPPKAVQTEPTKEPSLPTTGPSFPKEPSLPTTGPSFPKQTIVSTVPTAATTTCVTDLFSDIPVDLQQELPIGKSDLDVWFIDGVNPRAIPVGITLTDGGVTLGAIRFSMNTQAMITKIGGVFNADCTKTDDYGNADQPNPNMKNTLPNEGHMQLTLNGKTYIIGIGYRSDEKVRIGAKEK